MVLGGLGAFVVFASRALRREGARESYDELRRNLGRCVLMGLEVLIVADIVRTIIVDPTLESVGVLGIIVVIRILLSFALEVEIDGSGHGAGGSSPAARTRRRRQTALSREASHAGCVPHRSWRRDHFSSSWTLSYGLRAWSAPHVSRRQLLLLFRFRLLGFELGFDRDNGDPQRLGDLCGGGNRPWRAHDRCDRNQDAWSCSSVTRRPPPGRCARDRRQRARRRPRAQRFGP